VSLFGIHKTLYLLQNDLAFRERLRTDPEAALAEMPLTDKERAALLENDVAELYRMGAHTFLMSRLPRFNAFGGLTRERYQERLKVVLDEPERRTPAWMNGSQS
jgi:Aromatic-ring-opening dioxygenase LigAB, LigA subunit